MVKRKGKGRAKWNDKKRGRPKSFATEKIIEVYDLLPEDYSKISISELKKRVASKGMGYDTLYKYLKILMATSQIIREYGEEGYPPKVYYRRASPLGPKTRDLFFTEKFLALLYSLLSGVEDKKLNEELIGLRGELEEELKKTFEGELTALKYLYTRMIKQAGEIKLDEKIIDKRSRHIEVATKIHLSRWFDHLALLSWHAGDLITPDREKVEKYFTDENLERKKSLEKKVTSNKSFEELKTLIVEDADLEELEESVDLEEFEEWVEELKEWAKESGDKLGELWAYREIVERYRFQKEGEMEEGGEKRE